MGRRKPFKKEENSENWCFYCKDGGAVRICDYGRCVKVYHPKCVGKDNSFLEEETKWNCNWHFCHVCRKASKFFCICCPTAVCKNCLGYAGFAKLRREKGLCNSCLEFAWLIQNKKDVNSNECKTEMNDKKTKDFFFEDYWQKRKRKERITLKCINLAYERLKNGEMHIQASSAFESDEGEEETDGFEDESSDYHVSTDTEESKLPSHWNGKRKRTKGKMAVKKERSSVKKSVSVHSCIGMKANEVEKERRYPSSPIEMLPEQPQPLLGAPVMVADTQKPKSTCEESKRADEHTRNDGLTESSPGRTSGGNVMPCRENCSPNVSGSCTQPSSAVHKSHQEAIPVIIIDAKDETTEEINPLGEQVDFFARFDESVKDLPRSSHEPTHTLDQQNEALHCLQQCCSMSFYQLMNHDIKEDLLPSINVLLKSGCFPDDMLGMVMSIKLNFLNNIRLYSQCLENIRKAEEQHELTMSTSKELAENKIRFYKAHQELQDSVHKTDELKKQLIKERKFQASKREEVRYICKSSVTADKVRSESVQSSKILNKQKESSQQHMKGIDESWNRFKIESSKIHPRV